MDAVVHLNAALSGRYEVVREIGAGGMAVVYLARDLKHDRHVALKVLNPELGAVLGSERFLSEIKVTANLQHPNLLPLFDSGEAEGLLFYVMPFVEGETLRAKLDREKQLPVDAAVHIATAIASALDYAHKRGVIHRDLKPENILLQAGEPVIADFGIALAVSNAGGGRITQTGISLGTPQYMSPEQATGDRAIDGRTDIYSLGAMLYEMLAGDPPYLGGTSQAVIAKVLTERPSNVRVSRPSVPEHIAAAVERALEKLPADRWHTAHEFADAIVHARVVGPTSTGATPASATTLAMRARSPMAMRYAPWVVAAAALAFAVVRGVGGALSDDVPVRFVLPLPENTSVAVVGGPQFAVSPNGRSVAFFVNTVGARKIAIRDIDQLQPRIIDGTDGATNAVYSPNGEWIAFIASGQLRKFPAAGGSPLTLAPVLGASGMSWKDNNSIVISSGGRLVTVSSNGGDPVEIGGLDSANGELRQLWPLMLDDRNTIIYASFGAGGVASMQLSAASLKDGSKTPLRLRGTYPVGVVDGTLIYATFSGALMGVPFDVKNKRATGTPFPILDQLIIGTGGSATVALMGGTLVYRTGVAEAELVEFISALESRVVAPEPRNYAWPRYSPDGKRIAVAVTAQNRTDIWIWEMPTGPLRRLTSEGTINDRPEWTPDSRRVLFRSDRTERNSLWVQPYDRSEAAVPFFSMPASDVDEGVISRDNRYLVFQRDTTGTGDVWYRPQFGDTTPHPVEATRFAEHSARLSPDGKWVAYTSDESGVQEVYVKPFPSLHEKHQVSLDGGGRPVWSSDGKRLYYTGNEQILAVDVTTVGGFKMGTRRIVVPGQVALAIGRAHANFDVAGNDGRILALRTKASSDQVVVVYNWVAELRERLKTQARQ
ncbi:MAG TPA: protein kinase [Gemmatimonadaceae bacterium]|nr:protein kinase [Gemmatimonadaceae bacterium]